MAFTLLIFLCACSDVVVSGLQNSIDCTGITAKFAADVVPVFGSRTCTSSGCHVGSSPAGDLDLKAGDVVNTIYDNIFTANAVDLTASPKDPLNAPLVAKPLAGLTKHDGGDIFADLDDADLAKIYCWIESGAANN